MHTLLEKNIALGVKDFRDIIDERRRRRRKDKVGRSAIQMYDGNMWDYGRGYIGPLPVKDDDEASQILGDLKRRFTSRNVIAEVVDRAVDGLLSKSPDWKIYNNKDITNSPRLRSKPKPLPEAQFSAEGERIGAETTLVKDKPVDPKIEEAEYILSEVWSEAKLGDCLKDSVTQFLIEGSGVLRIYMPAKRFDQVQEFADAIKYIRVQYVENDKAEILDDASDKLSIIEISKAKDSNNTYEVSFIDDNGQTFIGAIDGTKKPTDQEQEDDSVEEIIAALEGFKEVSTPISLGGNLTADELVGKSFVTESMLQNNRALNLVLSLGIGVLIESGYSQMVTSNVALKKKDVYDPVTGETVPEDIPLERGATTLLNLIGEQTTDAQGNTNFAPVGVHWKDPSPLVTFVSGEELYYRQILSEAKQLFVLTTADNTISGESRVQARQDFLKKIQRYKPSLDNHGTWLLNTILKFVASACGRDGYFDDISVIFDSKIYAGELSADEKNVVISQYTAEPPLISRESAMVLLGTEEPLIEIEKIRQDQAEKIELQVRRLEATSKFGNMAENGQPKATPDEQANVKTKQKEKKDKEK